jgi:hypothetical protein
VWNGGGGYLRRGRGIRGERFESVRDECGRRYGSLMIKIFFDFFHYFFLKTHSCHPKKPS